MHIHKSFVEIQPFKVRIVVSLASQKCTLLTITLRNHEGFAKLLARSTSSFIGATFMCEAFCSLLEKKLTSGWHSFENVGFHGFSRFFAISGKFFHTNTCQEFFAEYLIDYCGQDKKNRFANGLRKLEIWHHTGFLTAITMLC
jgi:hypothetical protein